MQDGGPAFPILYPRADEDGRGSMSLRDWFAGMALQGMCANGLSGNPGEIKDAAYNAYRQADTMLAARN